MNDRTHCIPELTAEADFPAACADSPQVSDGKDGLCKTALLKRTDTGNSEENQDWCLENTREGKQHGGATDSVTKGHHNYFGTNDYAQKREEDRDSMAKSLYSALFDWIVLRINHALLNKKDMEESVTCLSIGVLDIFGFEDFETNSFEQFCINYANEQLQYYFNQHIFKLEQEEYQAEGITWHNIDYTDNVGCIHLISKKPTGLFYLLDEESNFPHATDKTLLAKFKQQHQGNKYFVPTPVMEPAFVIRHFAGMVKYQIKDFREKNTDHMRSDIVALLRSSDRAYVRQLIGMDPVAMFRWGILRATIRLLFLPPLPPPTHSLTR